MRECRVLDVSQYGAKIVIDVGDEIGTRFGLALVPNRPQIGWAGHPETKHISTHRIIWDTSAQAATLLARADKVVEYARSSPWPNLI